MWPCQARSKDAAYVQAEVWNALRLSLIDQLGCAKLCMHMRFDYALPKLGVRFGFLIRARGQFDERAPGVRDPAQDSERDPPPFNL